MFSLRAIILDFVLMKFVNDCVFRNPVVSAPTFPSELEWTSHPARERASAALAVSLLILVVATTAADLMRHWAYGVGSALFLLFTLRRFYWPTTYRLDGRGISATCLGRKQSVDWSDVVEFRHDARGGILQVSTANTGLGRTPSAERLAPESSNTSARSGAAVRPFVVEFGLRREEIVAAIEAYRLPGEVK